MALFRPSPEPATSMIYCLLCAQRREDHKDRPTVSFTDCKHTFCTTCLLDHHLKLLACAFSGPISATYKLENYTVRCPNCANPQATVGSDLAKDVPYSHPVRELLYGVKISKESQKKSPQCSECLQGMTRHRTRDARKRCLKCRKDMCEHCFNQHEQQFGLSTGSSEAIEHAVVRITQHEVRLKCMKHGKPVGLFCKQCRVLVCDTCMMDRRAHQDHPISLFKDVSQQQLESARELRQTIQKILTKKTQWKQYIAQLMKHQHESIQKAKKDLERNTEWLRKSVDQASKALSDQLDKFTVNMRMLYLNHTQYLDYTMHHLHRLQFFIQEMCQPGLEPAVLLHSQELKQHINNFDSDTKILGKEKQAMDEFQRALKFELKVELKNSQVNKIGDLSYERITGIDVPTPSFSAPLPKATFFYETEPGARGPAPGGLLFTSKGSLLVTEYSQGQIVKYNIPNKTRDDEVIRDPQCGFFPHKMDSDKKLLYVTDDNQKCVKAFAPSGERKMKTGKMFSSPSGIAVSADNKHLVVSDILDHTITILQASSGVHVRRFGKKGDENKCFHVPEFVLVDDDNQIVVSDRENHRVAVWTMDGTFVRKFGSKGSGPGELNTPMGLCKDEFGNILVVDSNNYRVCRFNPRGDYIDTVLTFQKGAAVPYGIAISKTGDIAVSDKTSSVVRVYHVYNYD